MSHPLPGPKPTAMNDPLIPKLPTRSRKRSRPASSTTRPLIPRKVQFDWSQTPLEWIPGQPFASHFINEINLLLPAGEFWFCKLYNQALPHITDPKLRDDVQMFVRQEAMHARAHGAAIAEYLHAHGIETERNTAQEDRLFDVLLADQPMGLQLPRALEKQWLVFRLGIVAAVEHMTCVLGNYVLRQDQWKDADPVLLDLLRWHGAEEVEHRCVAFDVYRHLGGRYVSRYYLASLAMPMIFGLWVHGAAHIMKQDPRFAARKPSVFRPWIWLEWQRQSKAGQLPSLFSLLRRELPFFSPWYDPVHEGSTAEALAYLERSPAARRAAAAATA